MPRKRKKPFKQRTINISNDVWDLFSEYCEENGYERSLLIEKLIRDLVKKNNQ